MAKPSANFSFIPNGLSVAFTDRSSGVPTSWLWDFGDAETSTNQSPTHVYATPGQYIVKLAATNNDGVDTLGVALLFNSTVALIASIEEMVEYNLPVGIPFNHIGFIQQVQTWQLVFQASAEVPDSNVFDETKWPPLYNVLISRLIIKDLIIRAANAASMGSFISDAENADTGTLNTSGNKGNLKDLEVGPSKAQWYDGSAYWANLFKTNADGSPGGIMAGIQTEICYYAARLTVKITGCMNEDTLGRVPLIVHAPCPPNPSREIWPWPINRG